MSREQSKSAVLDTALPAITDGSLIQVVGQTQVYLVLYQQTCYIPTPTVAANLFGTNWSSQVQQVTQAQFNQLPAGPPLTNACLVQATGQAAIYLLFGGYLYAIAGPGVMTQYGFNNGTVFTVPPAVIAALIQSLDIAPTPVPTSLPFPDGTLIQVVGSAAVFLVIFGQTCGIPDPTTANNLFGPGWVSTIQQVTQAQFNQYPPGPVFESGACLINSEGQIDVYSWGQRLWITNPTVQSTYNFVGTPVGVSSVIFNVMPQGPDITF